MRRAKSVGVAVMAIGLAIVALAGTAAELERIGIELSVNSHPLLVEGRLHLGTRLGVYADVSLGDGWTLRAAFDNPLSLWMPRVCLASSHAVADRWVVVGTVSAMGVVGVENWAQIMADFGIRYVLGSSPATRLTVSSFPVSLTATWYEVARSWVPAPGLSPNLFLDLAWAPTDHLSLEQSLGLSLTVLPGLDERRALPIGSSGALIIHSWSRAGFLP